MTEISFIMIVAGCLLVIVALLWKRFPPANVSFMYGYRTSSSMKNEDTWKEANHFSSRLLLKIGFIETLAGLLFIFLPLHGGIGVVTGLGFTICGLAFMIWRTEQHLSEVFDQDGVRRTNH